MKRTNNIEQSISFIDLPVDVIFYLKKFFFHAKKKKNSLDIKGFEYLLSVLSIIRERTSSCVYVAMCERELSPGFR